MTYYRKFSSKKQSGFTIAELIVVIVLISIMAAIAVPRWATSPNLDAQTQQLLSDLRYTQMLAMTHGQRFRLNFTLPSSYGTTNLAGTAVPNISTGGNTVALITGITITGLTNLPSNLVAFDERGIPYSDSAATTPLAANATITLSYNGITRSIVITQQTGSMAAQ
ncbi:MAG: type II secretion system protein [Gammaproteobacteria bacterium]|nr:type II secretion system protein [Gammaproteobacteria bacterium]